MKRYIVFIVVLIFVAGSLWATGKNQQEKSTEIKYDNVKIKKFSFAVQCWTFRKFTFFESLEKIKDLGVKYVEAYPGQQLSADMPDAKFHHDMSDEHIRVVKNKLNELGLTVVSYGVVGFDNNRDSMRKVFDFAKKMRIETINTEPSFDDYSLIDMMVKEYDIQVAIHNHPVPSKYALPQTVVEHIKGLDCRIGSCADTGHWLRSGVRPVDALRLLKGRIRNVHLKDLNKFNEKKAQDVPFGSGVANIHDILAELTLQGYEGYLSIEHENEDEVMNPSPSIRKGIDYVQSITYYQDYDRLLSYHRGNFAKHGWNHYGPGYFILDEKTGVLKSQKGMGLLWYAKKKYTDFVLELDFMSTDAVTNSGVFLRVPDMPVSDDYIYHSYEIQIDNSSSGIHRTGAVYDAEAPMKDAFNPPGEWNHYKITFKGMHIKVELNDQLIIDWDAEPRGKVRDIAKEGYFGLQNHDSRSPVYFRNIYIKEL